MILNTGNKVWTVVNPGKVNASPFTENSPQAALPLQINATTTHCKMQRGRLDSENLSNALYALEDAGDNPASVSRMFKGLDLRNLNPEQLEALVVSAAENNVPLSGCGVTEDAAADLIRRIEVRGEANP
jgi:hypothetical protein